MDEKNLEMRAHNRSGASEEHQGPYSECPSIDLPELTSPEAFFPHYQPIIGLTTGKIEGYETLARFRDSKGNVLSAGSLFFDPQIDPEFKLAVDRHVRIQALRTFAENSDGGYLTINISPRWVDRLDDLEYIPSIAMVEKSGIDPARVILEITESSGDLSRLKKIVKLYHAAGMKVAIDDFGAGASQIDRIEALEPDYVKLDMRFFKQASRGGISADIALAITTIASRVGCHVVCEGVENEEEFHFGIECGCSHIQGFIFYEALPGRIDSEASVQKVRKLQASYLGLKSGKLKQSAKQKEKLKRIVMAIHSHFVVGSARPVPDEMSSAGILRFFICDNAGNQLSANYEVSAGKVTEDFQCRGLNWSHRPYFPLFIALKDTLDHNFFASDIYRDVNSHNLCKTYSTEIVPGRILLVDAEVPDEIVLSNRGL